ncbi:hypothetical protein ElyMa_000178100 [Elysia marginata]|uniref:Uncharacterized protein n=1 Tax=Elysia marginata TaxID=1093978 RepID=A0AAV4ETF1_9GAST|nr:hypothetical protein ElyMa_000178100 [Elysia marginata]
MHSPAVSITRNVREDLMHIDELKDVDQKLDILIEFVCRIKLEHAWDHVQPHELNNVYTSLTNCTKGSMRKNSQRHLIPKRSRNPFLIWSSQYRSGQHREKPAAKRLCLRPTEAQQQTVPHNTIDPENPVSASTVLPTADYSPHPLVTSATSNESALRVVSNTPESHQLFNFTRPAAPVPVLMPQIPVSSTVNRTNSSHIVFPLSSLCKASASPNNIDVVDSRFIRTVKPVPVSRQWPLNVETNAGLLAPAPVIKTQPEVTNTFPMPP